ncbi:MAG: hypothetical protein IPI67_38960 [Myxococcales bacterium]|nr:hypothetical protein [Myxococcales bacterium]
MTTKTALVRSVAAVVALALGGCSASTADPAADGVGDEDSEVCGGKCDHANACSYSGGFVETVAKGPHDNAAGVALTLTAADAVSNDALGAVLDALDAAGVRANFFVSKAFLTNLSAVNASRIRARNDQVSPYLYINYLKPAPTADKVKESLYDTETALAKHELLSPQGSLFFRFPYGGSCAHQEELHARIGRISVGWHVHDQGLVNANANTWRTEMNKRVNTTQGGVVLVHLLSLTKKRASEAFAPWLKDLAAKYVVTTLGQRANFPGYANRLDSLMYRVPGPFVQMSAQGEVYAGVAEPKARVFFRAKTSNYVGDPDGEVELSHSEGCAAGTCREQIWSTNENAANCLDPSPILDAQCSITSSLTGKASLLIPASDFGAYQYLGKGLGNGSWTLSAPPLSAGNDAPVGFGDWEVVITGTNPKAERFVPVLAEWTGAETISDEVAREVTAPAILSAGGAASTPVLFKKTGAKLNPIKVVVEIAAPTVPQGDASQVSLSLLHADWPEVALVAQSPVVSGSKVTYSFTVDLNSSVFAKEDEKLDASRSFTRSPLGAWSLRFTSPALAGAKLTAFRVSIN